MFAHPLAIALFFAAVFESALWATANLFAGPEDSVWMLGLGAHLFLLVCGVFVWMGVLFLGWAM